MKHFTKRIGSIALGITLIASSFATITPRAYMVDDVVTVKTLNQDVNLSTTANSVYTVEDLKAALDLDSTAVGAASRVTTTTIDPTDLSNWYVYDHYDPEAYGLTLDNYNDRDYKPSEQKPKAIYKKWKESNDYNENLRPFYNNQEGNLNSTHIAEVMENGGVTNPDNKLNVDNIYMYLKKGTEIHTVNEILDANETGSSNTIPIGYVYNLKEHIQAGSSNGQASMNFYGYPRNAYSDFLFYPATANGIKKVNYTINATNVRIHSLNSAGFLFNTGVKTVKSGSTTKQILNGYVMLFSFDGDVNDGAKSASGLKEVAIYQLKDVDVEQMHDKMNWKQNTVTNFGGTLISKVDLSNTDVYPFEKHFDVSDIAMEITSKSLKVTMQEKGTEVTSRGRTQTLFDIPLTENTGYGGFGPLVSYEQHSCLYTSSYRFSNLKMSITETDSVLDGVSRIDYIHQGTDATESNLTDSDKYFVLIGDNTQGDKGYKDFFHLQNDAVFLEKLKKQNVKLITNLNVEPVAGKINGTNYKLADYLGEGNVVQVSGKNLAELASAIKEVIVSGETYDKASAIKSKDSMKEIIEGEKQSAAGCMVTYKNYQVDTVDANKIPIGGIELAISDPSPINVTQPSYQVTKPDGSVLELGSTNTFKVEATGSWPTGTYTASITYAEGVQSVATFVVTGLFDSYLNGVCDKNKQIVKGVKVHSGDVGKNTVVLNKEYKVVFEKEEGIDYPTQVEIAVDSNNNGKVDADEYLADGEYTLEEKEHVKTNDLDLIKKDIVSITISASKVAGDVYLTAKPGYDVYGVTWNIDALTKLELSEEYPHQASYFKRTDSGIKAKLLWADHTDSYGAPNISVVVGGQTLKSDSYTYDSTTGEFNVPALSITDDVVITANRPFLRGKLDKKLRHITLSGPAMVVGSKDFDATLKADEGYKLPDSIEISYKSAKNGSDDYVTYEATEYTYNPTTGAISVPKDQIDGDLRIVAEGVSNEYSITAMLKNLSYGGDDTGNPAQQANGKLIVANGYLLPSAIAVTRAGEPLTQGFTYDDATGEIVFNEGTVTGDIVITANGASVKYTVTPRVKNGAFHGNPTTTGDLDYMATVEPAAEGTLPAQIAVTIGGVISNQYTYDSSRGAITIPKDAITGDIVIVAECKMNQYKISYETLNIQAPADSYVDGNAAYTYTLVPDANCKLLSSISVLMGDKELVRDTDYFYSSGDGVLRIPANVIKGDILVKTQAFKSVSEEQKIPQPAPKKEDFTVIPPTYENSNDGKIIGVTKEMEYSLDGGKIWKACTKNTIDHLGVGKVLIRLKGDDTKQNSKPVTINIKSKTSEYYIPTISMSKKMGCNQKFQIYMMNTKGAAVKVQSTNKKVATVNRKGVVSSKNKTGKTKIVFTILKGKHIVQYVANVTVDKKIKKNYSLSKFKTKYQDPGIALYKVVYTGKTWNIKMTHTKGTTISYQSSDNSVASVSKHGAVTGRKKGTATITVTVKNDGVTDQYFVVVRVDKKGVPVTDTSYLKVLK